MALNERFRYESNIDEIPDLPHVPRSARGRRSIRKKVEENNMSAFDILAAVAGKLLSKIECPVDVHDGETRTDNTPLVRNTVKGQLLSKEKSFKTEAINRQDLNGKMPGCEIISEKKASPDVKEPLFITKSTKSRSDSDAMEPNKSHWSAIAKESSTVYNKCETPVATEKSENWNKSSRFEESRKSKDDWSLENANKPKMRSLDDPMDLDAKPSALLSSDSSAKVPFYRNNSQHTSCIPKYKDGMEPVVDKDDEERSSGCTHSSTLSYKDTKLQRIGDRRIRKIVASKHWKVAPKLLHNGDFSKRNIDMKPAIHGKKICYTHQRNHSTSFKRRKLFVNPSLSTSRERAFNEAISDLHNKGTSVKVEGKSSSACGANGASSATSGHKISYETPDCHVKLRIKSFKVPELFIEIPETATVASLKRTVMETVTAILGSGLRVGVLLEGKKVRDDNKTLRQAGISHGDKLDNLGFTLEPSHTQASAPLTSSGNPSFLGIADAAEPQARISPNDHPLDNQVVTDSTQLALTSCPESDDSSHSPLETSVSDKTMANSLALVAVLPTDTETLAVVPLRKPKRSEVVQRRIRRPFTVAEVEALVHAVEKLGTGRWRDVKQRAFDNAKHRTYVDLKDKWKTLVHTARISPQQRRGEPVPQDLLDRVLSAHAYWSRQQVKPSPHPDLPSTIL